MIPARIETAAEKQMLLAHIQILEGKIVEMEGRQQAPQPMPIRTVASSKSKAYSIAANQTLEHRDMGIVHYANCTANSTVTLPSAIEGDWVTLVNVGSATLTVKDGGTTVATLATDSYCHIPTIANGSGVPIWPSLVPVYGKTGVITVKQDVVWDTTSYGPVLKDTNGHYWRITVNTSGTQVVTDTGTSPPL